METYYYYQNIRTAQILPKLSKLRYITKMFRYLKLNRTFRKVTILQKVIGHLKADQTCPNLPYYQTFWDT